MEAFLVYLKLAHVPPSGLVAGNTSVCVSSVRREVLAGSHSPDAQVWWCYCVESFPLGW